MTALPPEPDGSCSPAARGSGRDPVRETHTQRQVAEGFGADAGRYDRARPGYPAGLIDWILAASPGRDVLDVGAGTGIVARLLQARGCRVLGVEPDPRMAEAARRRGLDVEVAKIEDWDPAGRVFDAAVAGQVWHWVEPVAGAATVAKALSLPRARRPGGRVAVFWNVYEPEEKMRAAFGSAWERAETGAPFNPWTAPAGAMVDGYLRMCDRAADGLARAGGFGPPEKWQQAWCRPYTRDEWLDVVPTLGGMNRVPAGRLARLLSGLGEAIDAAGGGFTMNYTTVAVAATRS
ncbi:MAG: class I SAM-dependent methyltransferase [Nocardiopsaceae bacterium]|nr:class I SAM-dependent methyltransferase [Nocardiopsaceae bacterium]